MRLTERQLNRTVLQRQMLLGRERVSLTDALGRVLAIQAQEPVSPYIALWNRVDDFEPGDLDRAFAQGQLVKASLMRITLHAVASRDYPTLHAAMRPSLRASRLHDRRFTESGLSIADVDAYEPALLRDSGSPRSGSEMIEALRAPFGQRATNAWWAYRTYAQLHHAPVGQPWSFGARPSFMAAPVTLPADEHERAVDSMVERYLRAFGPAGIADIARFTLLTRGVARSAIVRLGDAVSRHEGPAGADLYDVADGEIAPEGEVPARLLPMWESTLLGHDDRSRFIPPTYRPHVIRRNGDVLPTLLVDGQVAGVWRHHQGAIEATAFEPLPAGVWTSLSEEAARLLTLLEPRESAAYGRFARWWDVLPATEVRTLPD